MNIKRKRITNRDCKSIDLSSLVSNTQTMIFLLLLPNTRYT